MNREEILNLVKTLASSQGFYTRLYQFLSENSEESEEYLDLLVNKNFKDQIDLILYFEG